MSPLKWRSKKRIRRKGCFFAQSGYKTSKRKNILSNFDQPSLLWSNGWTIHLYVASLKRLVYHSLSFALWGGSKGKLCWLFSRIVYWQQLHDFLYSITSRYHVLLKSHTQLTLFRWHFAMSFSWEVSCYSRATGSVRHMFHVLVVVLRRDGMLSCSLHGHSSDISMDWCFHIFSSHFIPPAQSTRVDTWIWYAKKAPQIRLDGWCAMKPWKTKH